MDEARFVLSKSRAVEQYNKVKSLGLKVSYSLKTNPDVGIVLEKETDSLFTADTLQGALMIKDPGRVTFMCQALEQKTLDTLFSHGVRTFVVDNETDLLRLLKYTKEREERINLFLRMRIRENTIFTGKYFVFGMKSDRINHWVGKLRGNRNIEKLGIHFHRKTQNVSEWSLKEELSDSLSRDTLESVDFINIGGGLPVRYKNTTDQSLPHIFSRISELREWLKEHGIEAVMEPGRFIAAPAVTLEAGIILVSGMNITINCSVYNAAMDTLIVPIKLLVKGELESGKSYTIKGCTPCSMDIFRYDVKLNNPKTGDRITFLNAGAYNFSSDFCNLPKLKTVVTA